MRTDLEMWRETFGVRIWLKQTGTDNNPCLRVLAAETMRAPSRSIRGPARFVSPSSAAMETSPHLDGHCSINCVASKDVIAVNRALGCELLRAKLWSLK